MEAFDKRRSWLKERMPGVSLKVLSCLIVTVLLIFLSFISLYGAQLTVTWNPNVEPDLAGYRIHWGTSSGSYDFSVDVGNVTQYRLTDLQGGLTYFVALTAYDLNGNESGFSREISRYVPVASEQGSLKITVGEVDVDYNWAHVTFTEPFDDPVVIAKPLSRNGSDPAVVHIRNVDQNGFEIRVREWNYLNGDHPLETVGYLVLERGTWLLPDGTMVQAGRFETNWTSSFGWVSFDEPFHAVPVVITVVSTCNGTDVVTTRMRNIRREGFDFCMQEQESKNQSHPDETILYVAWEPSVGTISNLDFEISTTPNAVTDSFYSTQFGQAFINAPVLIADMQTSNGDNTANLRWRNKDRFGVEIQVDEEESKDSETSHGAEVVGYMVFDITS